MDRYGEAIEYDLHVHYRLDLLDFFRGRHSWRKLRNLIDRLPVNSAYREAVLDDPEVAERIARSDRSGPPVTPPLTEFGPTEALLTVVADRLGDVLAQLVANGGHKPPKVQPLPRPVTGVDRAAARLERLRHESLVEEVKAAQERWTRTREEGA